MAGIAVIFRGNDFKEIERFATGHIGIDKQYPIAIGYIGDMLDLQLHIVLALNMIKLQAGDMFDQRGTERIVTAPGVAVSEEE